MNDSQVMAFYQKEVKAGTSRAQIVTKLMQRGVDISQIRRIRDQYQQQNAAQTRAHRYETAMKQVRCSKTMARLIFRIQTPMPTV